MEFGTKWFSTQHLTDAHPNTRPHCLPPATMFRKRPIGWPTKKIRQKLGVKKGSEKRQKRLWCYCRKLARNLLAVFGLHLHHLPFASLFSPVTQPPLTRTSIYSLYISICIYIYVYIWCIRVYVCKRVCKLVKNNLT